MPVNDDAQVLDASGVPRSTMAAVGYAQPDEQCTKFPLVQVFVAPDLDHFGAPEQATSPK